MMGQGTGRRGILDPVPHVVMPRGRPHPCLPGGGRTPHLPPWRRPTKGNALERPRTSCRLGHTPHLALQDLWHGTAYVRPGDFGRLPLLSESPVDVPDRANPRVARPRAAARSHHHSAPGRCRLARLCPRTSAAAGGGERGSRRLRGDGRAGRHCSPGERRSHTAHRDSGDGARRRPRDGTSTRCAAGPG